MAADHDELILPERVCCGGDNVVEVLALHRSADLRVDALTLSFAQHACERRVLAEVAAARAVLAEDATDVVERALKDPLPLVCITRVDTFLLAPFPHESQRLIDHRPPEPLRQRTVVGETSPLGSTVSVNTARLYELTGLHPRGALPAGCQSWF